jgi:hypothetical protein
LKLSSFFIVDKCSPGSSNTWINTYGTNGKDIADLDLGRAYTSGNQSSLANLINTLARLPYSNRWFSRIILSYNSGNNSGTYPAIPNSSSGCSLNSIAIPGNAAANQNFTYSSYRTGLYLDANATYQSS